MEWSGLKTYSCLLINCKVHTSIRVKVNAVLWFRVSDPKKAVLTVESFRSAVQQVALTSLRNVIGQHDLDEVLKERD